MNTCSNCGHKFEGNFCPNCGEKVKAAAPAATRSFCPNCGTPLNGSAAFCPGCGKALSDNAAPARQTPPAGQSYVAPSAQQNAGPAGRPMASAQPMNPPMRPAGQPNGNPVAAMPAPGAHGIMPYPPAESRFTGGAFGRFGVNFLVLLVSIITLTLGLPAMICFKQRYLASRTIINGRKLYFDGKAMQLIGKYIVWLLLSIITLGIYLIFLTNRMEKWVTSHKHFEGVQGGVSKFTGSAIVYFFVCLWALIVTIITLSFGAHWATCFKQRWKKKHTYIDGHKLYFDGTALQLFGKRICWALLTIITLGIFYFWYKVKVLKWITYHTHANIYLDPTVPQLTSQTQSPSVGASNVSSPAAVLPFSTPIQSALPQFDADAQDLSRIRSQFPELNIVTSSFEGSQAEEKQDTSAQDGISKNNDAPSIAENADDTAVKTETLSADEYDFVNGKPAETVSDKETAQAEVNAQSIGNEVAATDVIADAAIAGASVQNQSAAEHAPAQGAGKTAEKTISVTAILYAIPSAAFLLLSIFFFLFMTGSVSKDLFGTNYYQLHELEFAVSAANMSIVCTSLLLVTSLLFGAFALYTYFKKTETRAWKLPVRWFFEGVCALFTLLVFIAACMILGKLGKYEASAGAAPILCLIFALLFLGGIATAEVFFTKKSASLGFATATAKETFQNAITAANKKFVHPDLKEDGIFAVEKKDDVYSNDHKIGEALAYANKGAARRNMWPFVTAIVIFSLVFFFAIGWFASGATPVYLFVTDIIFALLLLVAVIVCMVFASSERKQLPVDDMSSLSYIRSRKKNALKLAITNAALAVISIICMIVLNAVLRNALLTYADFQPVIFINFYFLRTISNGLGEFFLYYFAVYLMFLGGLKAYADLRRYRAYSYAAKELSKTVADENAPLGARWAMLKNALRENELAAGKKIKYVSGSKQVKTITPRFKRFLATATSAVLCIAIFLCIMPAVQNNNTSLGNAENLVAVYNDRSFFDADMAELFFGKPYEKDEETGSAIYFSKNYMSLVKKAEELEKKMANGKISMEKYITESAKLAAKAATMTYRRVTITEDKVLSEVIRGENIFGDSEEVKLSWLKVATTDVAYPKAFDNTALKLYLTEELLLKQLESNCFYTAKFSDGSVEVAGFVPTAADILSVSSSSAKVRLSFVGPLGMTEETVSVRLRKDNISYPVPISEGVNYHE